MNIFILILIIWIARGFMAHYATPILLNFDIIENIYLEKNGLLGFDIHSQSQIFILYCTILFFSIFILILFRTMFFERAIEFTQNRLPREIDLGMIGMILLLLFFGKKFLAFVLNPEYFANFQIWGGRSFEYRYIIHCFLPNIIGATGAILLTVSQRARIRIFGLILLVGFIFASVLFGSRGLSITIAISTGIAIMSLLYDGGAMTLIPRLLGGYTIPGLTLIVSLIILGVEGVGYSAGNASVLSLDAIEKNLNGNLARFDVMHLISHVNQTAGCVPLALDNNLFSRWIGVLSPTDFVTGVGYPGFLYYCGPDRVIGIVINGLVLAMILMATLLVVKTRSRLWMSTVLFTSVWIGLHWPELSFSDLSRRLSELFIIISIILSYLGYVKFFSSVSGLKL